MERTFPAASFSELLMEIFKHGSGVEVIKPKKLREMVKTDWGIGKSVSRGFGTVKRRDSAV
jgi:predicted DNA-binding transcriptional regulator YafY